jgi:hypothetical protein
LSYSSLIPRPQAHFSILSSRYPSLKNFELLRRSSDYFGQSSQVRNIFGLLYISSDPLYPFGTLRSIPPFPYSVGDSHLPTSQPSSDSCYTKLRHFRCFVWVSGLSTINELSEDESEKENDAPVSPVAAAAANLMKTASDALRAETKLQSFVDTLTKLNQKLIEDRNAHKCDAEDTAQSLKHSGSTIGLSDASRHVPYSRNLAASSSRIPPPSSSSSSSQPPKLTDCERKYLEMYNGCKKCCNFYMPENHSCKFPTGDGYIECSMTMVNDAHKRIKLPALPVPREEVVTTVGAVSNIAGFPPQPAGAPPPLPIASVLGMSSYPITSVYPPNDSSVLAASDSDLSRDSNDSVRTHVPFLLPHLLWECAVDSHNISSLSHVPVSALIDHGSPPVLIDQSLVNRLHLPTHLLPRPFPVSGAFFANTDKSSHVSLTHWVKLKLHD